MSEQFLSPTRDRVGAPLEFPRMASITSKPMAGLRGDFFGNIRIVWKIGLAVALLAVFAVVIAAYGLVNMSDINQRLRFLTGTAAERVRLAGEAQMAVEAIGRDEKDMILTTDAATMDKIAAAIRSSARGSMGSSPRWNRSSRRNRATNSPASRISSANTWPRTRRSRRSRRPIPTSPPRCYRAARETAPSRRRWRRSRIW